jgi:hypothetical protein
MERYTLTTEIFQMGSPDEETTALIIKARLPSIMRKYDMIVDEFGLDCNEIVKLGRR